MLRKPPGRHTSLASILILVVFLVAGFTTAGWGGGDTSSNASGLGSNGGSTGGSNGTAALSGSSSPNDQTPPASVITTVTVAGSATGKPIPIPNSQGDLWFSTWASDDNIYSTWGDGKGFGGVFSDVGIAKLTGSPPNFTGQNVYNEVHPSDLADNDKPSSLLAIGKRIYGHLFSPLAQPWIGYTAYSDDFGRTWTRVGFYKQGQTPPTNVSPWTSTNNSNFRCLSYINMGKGYELNTDGYVYGYGLPQPGRWNGGIHLSRVPTVSILDYSAYEYYAGESQCRPIWSKSESQARVVPGLTTKSQVSVIYHPGVKRYILMTQEDIFDAPNPWGPWTLAGHWNSPPQNGWLGGYQPGIIPKYTDSNSFWFTIAGQNQKGAQVSYQLNLGKIILVTQCTAR